MPVAVTVAVVGKQRICERGQGIPELLDIERHLLPVLGDIDRGQIGDRGHDRREGVPQKLGCHAVIFAGGVLMVANHVQGDVNAAGGNVVHPVHALRDGAVCFDGAIYPAVVRTPDDHQGITGRYRGRSQRCGGRIDHDHGVPGEDGRVHQRFDGAGVFHRQRRCGRFAEYVRETGQHVQRADLLHGQPQALHRGIRLPVADIRLRFQPDDQGQVVRCAQPDQQSRVSPACRLQCQIAGNGGLPDAAHLIPYTDDAGRDRLTGSGMVAVVTPCAGQGSAALGRYGACISVHALHQCGDIDIHLVHGLDGLQGHQRRGQFLRHLLRDLGQDDISHHVGCDLGQRVHHRIGG